MRICAHQKREGFAPNGLIISIQQAPHGRADHEPHSAGNLRFVEGLGFRVHGRGFLVEGVCLHAGVRAGSRQLTASGVPAADACSRG